MVLEWDQLLNQSFGICRDGEREKNEILGLSCPFPAPSSFSWGDNFGAGSLSLGSDPKSTLGFAGMGNSRKSGLSSRPKEFPGKSGELLLKAASGAGNSLLGPFSFSQFNSGIPKLLGNGGMGPGRSFCGADQRPGLVRERSPRGAEGSNSKENPGAGTGRARNADPAGLWALPPLLGDFGSQGGAEGSNPTGRDNSWGALSAPEAGKSGMRGWKLGMRG